MFTALTVHMTEHVTEHVTEHTIYGQIKNNKRIRLSHEKADKLVYCHEALHLQNKLQKAGYEAKVERWDTDSDSNASDEDLKQ